MKRTRVKPYRSTPRRREAPRWTADEWEAADWQLTARANGCCERCGHTLDRAFTERHHRQRRRDGGDRLANLLLLCSTGTGLNGIGCHQWITEHPTEATEQGWIVPVWDDPATTPVRLPDGRLWLLHDNGSKSPLP